MSQEAFPSSILLDLTIWLAARHNDSRYGFLQIKNICVFCGSSRGSRDNYSRAARALASEMVGHRVGLVYGGASVGLMGVLADAVLGAGGHVTGIIPSFLADKELAHPALTDLEIVGSMHERKARMAELADAFIALPGGFGTFEELCEVLTWAQLGLHRKPCAVLNVAGFFNPLLAMFDHAVTEGFLKARYREMLIDEADAAKLLSRLEACQLPAKPEWANIART